MRKLWSNTRERTQSKEKEQAEDSSYPKGIEVLLRETARKDYPDPENVDNPKIAPQDYDARQSRRVLELQNRSLWIRPTDLSWHLPILVTIREMPFRNHRGRALAKLEARDEAKKQKTLENRDNEWNSTRHLGPGLLHPQLLLGESGAQARHMSKRVRTLRGSHTTSGNEVIFIGPHKASMGDENNVCL